MALKISPRTCSGWNDNSLTILDGSDEVTICVHDKDDPPTAGQTVKVSRQDMLDLCETFFGVPKPVKDCQSN